VTGTGARAHHWSGVLRPPCWGLWMLLGSGEGLRLREARHSVRCSQGKKKPMMKLMVPDLPRVTPPAGASETRCCCNGEESSCIHEANTGYQERARTHTHTHCYQLSLFRGPWRSKQLHDMKSNCQVFKDFHDVSDTEETARRLSQLVTFEKTVKCLAPVL